LVYERSRARQAETCLVHCKFELLHELYHNIMRTWPTNKNQHAGAEGRREYPIHMAYTVKDMYDHLAGEGFRPMIIGWSLENPFPMIGGVEPPEPPKMPKIRRATTWSNTSAGHAADSTPHDRVLNIIKAEEEKEAKARADLVKAEMVREGLTSDIKMSAC
jgi:hypothetical protein